MFFLFLSVSLFLAVFHADKLQLWAVATDPGPALAPMVWGPLGKLAWKFAGRDISRFLLFQFFLAVAHIVVIGLAFDKLKIGSGEGSGIIPAIVVSLAMAVFWGSFYVRRKKVV